MIIDNSSKIRNLLEFPDNPVSGVEFFYVVQLIQRQKDNPTELFCNKNHRTNSNRSLYQTQIYSLYDYDTKLPLLIKLAHIFQSRIYINLNIKSSHTTFINMVKNIGCRLETSNYTKLSRFVNEAIGECRGSALHKDRWIVDIDTYDTDYITKIENKITELRGSYNGHGHIYEKLPTKNGVHLITCGFDLKKFRDWEKNNVTDPVDIHKDNPTILWINTDWSKQE